MSGKFDRVVFELCCEEDSVLGTNEALASDLPQICRRFCSRSSEAAIRSFDIEFLGPEFGLVWQRL